MVLGTTGHPRQREPARSLTATVARHQRLRRTGEAVVRERMSVSVRQEAVTPTVVIGVKHLRAALAVTKRILDSTVGARPSWSNGLTGP